MLTEIERKFLVTNDSWKKSAITINRYEVIQAYISLDPVVRVRSTLGKGFITIKKKAFGGNGCNVNYEYEYEIPHQEALDLLNLFPNNVVSKTRNELVDEVTGHVWEIDEFQSENIGLVVAEIELDDPLEEINLNHEWLGEEVSDNHMYENVSLATYPYCKWPNK